MRWLLIHPGPSWSVADVFNGWSEALTGLGEQVEEYELDARLRFYNGTHRRNRGAAAVRLPGGAEVPGPGAGHPARRRRDPRRRLPVVARRDPVRVRVLRPAVAPGDPPRPRPQDHHADDGRLRIRTTSSSRWRLRGPDAAQRPGGPGRLPADRPRRVHAARLPGKIHYPPAPGTEPEYDFAFVGTGFPSRARFFSQMDLAGLNVRLAGLWMDLPEDSPMRDWTATESDDCIDNDETAEIYRRARDRHQLLPAGSRGRPRGRGGRVRAPGDRDGRVRAVVRPRPPPRVRRPVPACCRRSGARPRRRSRSAGPSPTPPSAPPRRLRPAPRSRTAPSPSTPRNCSGCSTGSPSQC